MASDCPKQYLSVAGQMVIEHTLERLLSHPSVQAAYVAVAQGDAYWSGCRFAQDPRVVTVPGGAQRCHSVLSALGALRGVAHPEDWVLIHDAARPCITAGDIDRLIAKASLHRCGGLLAVPISDTVKRANSVGEVVATVDRRQLWRAFTPQMFRLAALEQALRERLARDEIVTDEAQAMELAGCSPVLVLGRADNIKITHRADLRLAEFYFANDLGSDSGGTRL